MQRPKFLVEAVTDLVLQVGECASNVARQVDANSLDHFGAMITNACVLGEEVASMFLGEGDLGLRLVSHFILYLDGQNNNWGLFRKDKGGIRVLDDDG